MKVRFLAIGVLSCMTPAIAAADPTVFYLQPGAAECRWLLFDANTKTTQQMMATPQCPTDIVWDTTHQQTYFVMGDKLYQRPGEEKSFSEIGPARSGKLWMSLEGRLRVLTAVPVPESTVEVSGGKTFIRYEGRSYPLKVPRLLQDFGEKPAILRLEEWGEDGRWKTLGMAATKVGLPYSLDLESEAHPERVMRQYYALKDGYAPRSLLPLMRKASGSFTLKEFFGKAACDRTQECTTGEWKVDIGRNFWVGFTAYGVADHVLTEGPVRIYQRNPACGKDTCGEEELYLKIVTLPGIPAGDRRKPNSNSYAPQMDIRGGFALVTDSETNNGPRVIEAGNFEPILSAPEGQAAFWWPL